MCDTAKLGQASRTFSEHVSAAIIVVNTQYIRVCHTCITVLLRVPYFAATQVTKLVRAGAALAFAPVVDRCLVWAVEKLKLDSKQQAFSLVVAACLALAAVVFGAVVAVHA